MIRILKELKPFSIIILIIIGLLFGQAMTDLALPDYMSKIVNIGIQQNGIENPVPEMIRSKEMEKIKIFLTEEEKSLVDHSYELKEEEDLYILIQDSKEDIEIMDSFLGRAILTVMALENDINNPFTDFPEGMDPFLILENMDERELSEIRNQIHKQFEELPESMINQSAINYIKAEYEEIGIDIEETQTKYVLSIGGKMLAIALLGMIASILVGFFASRVSASLGRNLRDKVFTKVTTFSNAELDDFSTASLITRSTNDIQQVQQFTVMIF